MSLRSVAVLGAVAVAALTAPTALVEAHQRVFLPDVVYTVANRNTNWGPQAKLEKQGYKTTADFNAYLKANNYKTLREFMDKPGAYKPNSGATFECGFTDPKAPAQPIPKDGAFRTSGYTHEGPCEIWIDDVRVKHGDNCHFDISETAFTDKIDYSACKGTCMLKWYWLGIRPTGKSFSWQIYKACIPLSANGGGAAAAPNTTTAAPAVAEKPVAGEASSKGCRRLLD
jgi:hypothetical protein